MSTSVPEIRRRYAIFAHISPRFWGEHIHHGLFLRGHEQPAEAQIAMLEHCLALLKPRRDALLLDVGCGHGGTAVYIATARGWRVHGITISETQARFAKRIVTRADLRDRAQFFVSDANRLALPAASYDVIWTMECTEHLADRPAFISNAAATIRPGGEMLIAAWTGSMEKTSVQAVAKEFLCPSLQTAEDYVEQLRDAGLEIRALEDLSAGAAPTWTICRDRVQGMRFVLPLMPRSVRNFVAAIDVIIGAYRCGDLHYSVITAAKNTSKRVD